MLKKITTAFIIITIAFSGSFIKAAADGGYTDEEIENSEVKPRIVVSKEVLSLDYAKAHPKRTITISIYGAENKYCCTGLRVNFDQRLTMDLDKSGNPDVKLGEACEGFMHAVRRDKLCPSEGTHSSNIDPTKSKQVGMDGFFLTSASAGDNGGDGVLYTLDVTLPKDIQPGDVFPIDVLYKEFNGRYDLFDDTISKYCTMGPYLFTRGIYNKNINPYPGDDYLEAGCEYDGYIAIKKEA